MPTFGVFTEEALLKAEKTARENRGGARTKGRKVNGDILEEANWPADAVADGKVYSLEVAQAMILADELDDEGKLAWRPKEPRLTEPPEFETMTGTYTDVARRAGHLNGQQLRGNFLAWIFYPAPVDPQGVS